MKNTNTTKTNPAATSTNQSDAKNIFAVIGDSMNGIIDTLCDNPKVNPKEREIYNRRNSVREGNPWRWKSLQKELTLEELRSARDRAEAAKTAAVVTAVPLVITGIAKGGVELAKGVTKLGAGIIKRIRYERYVTERIEDLGYSGETLRKLVRAVVRGDVKIEDVSKPAQQPKEEKETEVVEGKVIDKK